MQKLLSVLFVACALTACGKKEVAGVYVDISLENSANINSYVLFNPNIKTIEECEASMEKALPSIMANLPEAVPRDSKATGFECYLTDPREGKIQKPG